MTKSKQIRIRRRTGTPSEIPWSKVVSSDVLGGVPFRKVAHAHGHQHHPGWYWSQTAARHVMHESRLERWRLLLADFDPEVIDVREQPFQVVVQRGNGRKGLHVPDFFFARRTLGPLLVNVKAPGWEKREATRELTELMGLLCAELGWEYEIWTGASPTLLANLQWLSAYRDAQRCGACASSTATVRNLAKRAGTLGHLEELAAAAGVAQPRAVAMYLVWNHQLTTDLETMLDTGSPVTVAGGCDR